LVKKSLQLTPGIEPLYGTRDENLRLMEDGLMVQIDLRSDSIQLMGEVAAVARVEGIFADFEHLRKLGVHPHNGELNALLKMVVSDPAVTLRGLVESGKQRAVGTKRVVQPRSPNQRKYVESIETNDMVFGAGGYGQDVPGGGDGGERAAGEEGIADYSGAAGGGGWRAAGISAGIAAGEGRSVSAAAV
jgi:phosphate starvation-inducible PhoH-like protein